MLLMLQSADGGLTLERVLRDIPHDAGAIVIYVLMAGFIGLIWYGSRRDSGAGPEAVHRDDEQ